MAAFDPAVSGGTRQQQQQARSCALRMSNLSEPSKEAGSADDSSAVQKTGAWSSTLSILLQQASVYGVAAGYCLSASLLSIINKWAVMKFPYPGALTALQYFTSVAGVLLCGQLKLIEHDGLNLKTMWKFLPAAVMFYISIFTNSELLLHANVDTFIVFRSAVPIFVAIGETLYLHQPWPSLKTWLSLSTILGGSVIYVFTDNQFTVTAYTWAVAYLASMSIDFVYIKHVVMTIGLNTWGLVLYNNLEALMLYPLEMLLMGELNQMKIDSSNTTNWLSFDVILPVALSCLFGLSISFFGFSCRRAISATGFTVLGIVNKLLTVVINLLIWDKHASLVGTIGLLICMSGGVLYQQSTTKPKAPKVEPKEESDEEQQKLMEMQQGHESSSTQKQASS
uniref:Sugar phosphate transporter domain-containing protein n=1 Tax=Leersia perrieri TaxID=77586 RepID=A0A0D9VR85_9ORYZ